MTNMECEDNNEVDQVNVSANDQDNLDEAQSERITPKVNSKKYKRGIIYLSTIPQYMNVTKVREIFSQYGELGRVYLQPATDGKA